LNKNNKNNKAKTKLIELYELAGKKFYFIGRNLTLYEKRRKFTEAKVRGFGRKISILCIGHMFLPNQEKHP
jgi:hypothetical protein